MPAEALQPVERVHRIDQAGSQPELIQIAEVVGCQGRGEQQADICWRGAMSDRPNGQLLVVIGRQPMTFWTDESFEKTPGSPGYLTQEVCLFLVQGNSLFGDWPINPPYD
ncbi:MAG: hypothetical protein Q8N39_11290 [Pelolinea sp.]|nr:hypothetical protein [Pelolinea sp.]